jgi:5S rRNA maturation endonuclease (ribonuclease M5)
MRRTGQTFRVLLKAIFLASEEKQDIIIIVNKKDYGSSLIKKLYGIIKEHLGDFVEKNNYNKITLGNGSTITSMSFELYQKRCSQDAFRG